MKDIQEQLQRIKQLFRQHMNGVGAKSMKQKGLVYKLNYGIPFTELMEIASEFQPDKNLAQSLWTEPVRESKLLALLLMPQEEINTGLATQWIDDIETTELVEYASKYLFPAMPDVIHWAIGLIHSDNRLHQLAGIHTLSNVVGKGKILLKTDENECLEQLKVLQRQAEDAADITLLHAMHNLNNRF